MILKELTINLDEIFKKNLAFEWDKAGLQVGNLDRNIKKILIALDINNSVIKEAIDLEADLILSHHPLIFNPVDAVVSADSVQKKILNLVENKIAAYAAHTNYDIMPGGLNDFVAKILGLTPLGIIEPQHEQWYKFVVFVPKESEEKVRDVMCRYGGGQWKNYSCCTFNIDGRGTFLPLKGAKPYIGKSGKINYVNEVKIECIVSENVLEEVVSSTIAAHPYEEVAYDIYKIENKFSGAGVGRYGELKEDKYFAEFLEIIKNKMNIKNFRWLSDGSTDLEKKKISKVAVVNGSANSLTDKLAGLDCDLLILGEISHHNALSIIESGKILVEVGHGCSEKWAVCDMYEKLKEFSKLQKIKIEIIKSKLSHIAWRYYIE